MAVSVLAPPTISATISPSQDSFFRLAAAPPCSPHVEWEEGICQGPQMRQAWVLALRQHPPDSPASHPPVVCRGLTDMAQLNLFHPLSTQASPPLIQVRPFQPNPAHTAPHHTNTTTQRRSFQCLRVLLLVEIARQESLFAPLLQQQAASFAPNPSSASARRGRAGNSSSR